MIEPDNCQVFVYGTLKQGFGLHENYLRDQKRIGEAWLNHYQMRDLGNFPAIFYSRGSRCFGEIYKIPRTLLTALDRVEGVAHGLYARVGLNIPYYGSCFAYTQYTPKDGEEVQLVTDGIWQGRDKTKTVKIIFNYRALEEFKSKLPVCLSSRIDDASRDIVSPKAPVSTLPTTIELDHKTGKVIVLGNEEKPRVTYIAPKPAEPTMWSMLALTALAAKSYPREAE